MGFLPFDIDPFSDIYVQYYRKRALTLPPKRQMHASKYNTVSSAFAFGSSKIPQYNLHTDSARICMENWIATHLNLIVQQVPRLVDQNILPKQA